MKVRKATIDELVPRRTARELSVRARQRMSREAELRRALNLAATLPASEVLIIEPTDGETVAAIRQSLQRILDAEPRDLNWGVRSGRILVSKAVLPTRVR